MAPEKEEVILYSVLVSGHSSRCAAGRQFAADALATGFVGHGWIRYIAVKPCGCMSR
jgi:hypothetical protein